MAFLAFDRFFKLNQKSSSQKTYEEFSQSPYYTAFVKFGSFLHNVNPLYPEKFIDYIVTSGVKLDHWCRESLYYDYVIHLIKNESVETALQRSISTMMDWADSHNSIWNHYLHYVSSNRVTFDIKDGKISPWILLNSTSGKTLLNQLTDEQLSSIGPIIDLPFWTNKFRSNKDDLDLAFQVIKEGNL
ncbi:MAG: hypothetical protein EBT86_00560 [Actinobacteria bacterium]|nr:hypothetical protein [Actinomycetota bacterium]